MRRPGGVLALLRRLSPAATLSLLCCLTLVTLYLLTVDHGHDAALERGLGVLAVVAVVAAVLSLRE